MDSRKFLLALQQVKGFFSEQGALKPLPSDFMEKWARRVKGVKFPEDIDEDTRIEVLTYKFLCDISFFFYMLLTNQLPLFYALLEELEGSGKKGTKGEKHVRRVSPTRVSHLAYAA